MKTAEQIFKEMDADGDAMLWLSKETVTNAMKLFAEEVLREAAERVKTHKTGNSGSWYDASVDKDSILSLIEEIKKP